MKNCNQCGKCCINYGDSLAASKEEIDLWEIFNPEIYQYVKKYAIWFNPTSGQKLTQCPFLELAPKIDQSEPSKYTCSIYQNRPEDCRHYPTHISEMIHDNCEMIEIIDLENPKMAQSKLDILMKTSRPPAS